MEEVISKIPLSAFRTRTGYSQKEYNDSLEFLKRAYTCKGGKALPSKTRIELNISEKDVFLITQMLNEACNGLSIEDFEKRIGASRKATENILRDFVLIRNWIRENRASD